MSKRCGTYVYVSRITRTLRKKMGVTIKVETQGSSGIENKLTAKEIEEADCVIITNDVEIRESQRFKGKKVVKMSVSEIIKKIGRAN